jgi:hypothetical protein
MLANLDGEMFFGSFSIAYQRINVRRWSPPKVLPLQGCLKVEKTLYGIKFR